MSLIEIMVAMVVLAVVVIGGGALLYNTGGAVQKDGNRRVAVELVNTLLEQAKETEYLQLGDSTTNITINGIIYAATTAVQVIDNPVLPVADVKKFTVSTTYRDDPVFAESIIIPDIGVD